jgi:hypothetical protein
VLIIPVYNPTPGFSLKDGDFRGLPDRELPGHERRSIEFLAPKSIKESQKLLQTAARPIFSSAREGLEQPVSKDPGGPSITIDGVAPTAFNPAVPASTYPSDVVPAGRGSSGIVVALTAGPHKIVITVPVPSTTATPVYLRRWPPAERAGRRRGGPLPAVHCLLENLVIF